MQEKYISVYNNGNGVNVENTKNTDGTNIPNP